MGDRVGLLGGGANSDDSIWSCNGPKAPLEPGTIKPSTQLAKPSHGMDDPQALVNTLQRLSQALWLDSIGIPLPRGCDNDAL